jgi:hypothetical protein
MSAISLIVNPVTLIYRQFYQENLKKSTNIALFSIDLNSAIWYYISMGNFIDITGKRFGRLVVLNCAGSKNKKIIWHCKCDCGNEIDVIGNSLQSGNTMSCGCLHKEIAAETARKTHTKHGMIKTRLYTIWVDIKQRCRNKKQPEYRIYGGRGIDVCNEWYNSFETFRDWALNNGYQESLTIDRINNNGNYEPSNCRWATVKQQAENRRTNVFIEYNGERKTKAEWSRILSNNTSLVSNRLALGWNAQDAVSIPLTVHHHGKTNTRLHRIWAAMKARCYNKHVIGYKSNGARGVKICKEWKNDFEAFYKWAMGNGYRDDLVIFRMDNMGNYDPDNCCWIDRTTQSKRRPYTKHIEHNGESLTMAEWSKRLGGNSKLVSDRIKNGYDPIKAITEPLRINQFKYRESNG